MTDAITAILRSDPRGYVFRDQEAAEFAAFIRWYRLPVSPQTIAHRVDQWLAMVHADALEIDAELAE